ncbi:MAG: glycosyltransferase [Dongiaceae bacterium]
MISTKRVRRHSARPGPESAIPASSDPALPGRVCLVTGEIAGPDFNGGIGTANRGLALALRKAGFAVDVLYTRVDGGAPFCFRGDFADQVSAFASHGIRLMSIRHEGPWNDWPAKSFRAMEHLEAGRYHLAFFNDTHGTGFYPLLARRTGNARLSGTTMCVVAHSATQWIQQVNEAPIPTIEDIKLMEMERRSLELADIVVSPSRHLLGRYRGYGWSLPEDCRVIPNLLPPGESLAGIAPGRSCAVTEPVFFGRLESRKGLWLFCNALDRLKAELAGRTVTFLGKPTLENGESTACTLLRRSAAWPFEIRLLLDYDRDQALGYLRGAGRLAIMPSLEENSPCAIQECLEHGIPFIASSGSGGAELLAEGSRPDCLFAPTAAGIAAALRRALAEGAVTGALAFDPEENERRMMGWVAAAIRTAAPAPAAPARRRAAARPPLLLALVPAAATADFAAAQARQILQAFPAGAELVLLAARPEALAARLAGEGLAAAVEAVAASSFAAVATRAGRGPRRVAALFHVGQPVTPALVERARACFAAAGDIVAVSAMVARPDRAPSGPLPEHVSVPAGRRIVDRYLLGGCPALIPLSQEMNAGFALFRSEALAGLASVGPLDARYGRPKRVVDWIDELLFTLQAGGHRWELLPDGTLDVPPVADAFEVFRRGEFLRGLVQRQLGYAPGSHQALLSRLAIEYALDEDRHRAVEQCLAPIADKLGVVPAALSCSDMSSDHALRLVARIAHAAGQTELAEELLAELLEPGAGPGTLDDIVRRRAAEIRLFDLLSRGAFRRVNLDHDWSLKTYAGERAIEQHPNPVNEGRATLIFHDVDLRQAERFRAVVRLPSSAALPVRFRIEVIARDRSTQFDLEETAAPLEARPVEFALPAGLRTRSDILLTTEMAIRMDSPQHAWAQWVDPRFCGTTA